MCEGSEGLFLPRKVHKLRGCSRHILVKVLFGYLWVLWGTNLQDDRTIVNGGPVVSHSPGSWLQHTHRLSVRFEIVEWCNKHVAWSQKRLHNFPFESLNVLEHKRPEITSLALRLVLGIFERHILLVPCPPTSPRILVNDHRGLLGPAWGSGTRLRSHPWDDYSGRTLLAALAAKPLAVGTNRQRQSPFNGSGSLEWSHCTFPRLRLGRWHASCDSSCMLSGRFMVTVGDWTAGSITTVTWEHPQGAYWDKACTKGKKETCLEFEYLISMIQRRSDHTHNYIYCMRVYVCVHMRVCVCNFMRAHRCMFSLDVHIWNASGIDICCWCCICILYTRAFQPLQAQIGFFLYGEVFIQRCMDL